MDTIVTNNMKFEYARSIVYLLLQKKLITAEEYSLIIDDLAVRFKVRPTNQQSNEQSAN